MPIIKKGRKTLPAVLAVALGLLVAAAAWTGVMRQVKAGQATVAVAVPRHDILAYTPIAANDLTVKMVPVLAVDGYTLRDASEADGKAAAATLYAGKPIDRRSLIDVTAGSYAAAGDVVVGVTTNAARSAGVKSGDVVDVYCLRQDQAAQTGGGVQVGIKVASDARVLRVCDDQGQPLESGGSDGAAGGTLGGIAGAAGVGAPKEPKVVYLLVRAEEAPDVAPGAWDKGAVMVLVKKPYAGTNAQVAALPGQAGPQQAQQPPLQPSAGQQ